MSRHLFIGGPLDGRTIEVGHVELHMPFIANGPRPGSIEIFTYWPHRLWFEKEHETVYTLRRDPGIKIFQDLIKGYKRGEDYPDNAIELGRTYERQFLLDFCRNVLGHLPIGLRDYLKASLDRATSARLERDVKRS